VNFGDGYFSNYKGDTYYVRCVRGGQSGSLGSLVISVTPTTGPQGTTFSEPGSGFTPNKPVTLHFRKPDGTETTTVSKVADATGSYKHSWT